MTQIASYFARVGISTDLAQLKKVDRYLALIESKMRAFQKRAQKANGAFNINFKFNTSRLEFDVQRAFLNVSRRVRFPIENFTINRNSLATQISSAIRQAINSSNRNINLNPRVSPQARRGASAGVRDLLPAGIGGGLAGRLGIGGVSGLGAMYGLNRLNQANQEAISARLTTQAVVQAKGGTEKEGQQAFGWLRNLGNEVGFDYMAAAPDYNQFLSNALGAGITTGGAQDIFQGFSEYQTALGVTPARRKLVQNAMSQMLGKGKVSMEELEFRLAA